MLDRPASAILSAVSSGRLAKRFAFAAILLLGSGCILFVDDDPSKLSTTCDYPGRDTVCGACVATACATALDACCASSTCLSSVLPSLPQCAELSLDDCELLLAPAPDLASCLAASCPACAASNTTPDASTKTDASKGSTACTTIGDSCSCIVGHSNGVTCNPSKLPGPGLCCATYGWPQATDATCSCEPFSCTPESDGALCDLGTDSTRTTTWSGPDCCTFGTNCSCGPDFSDCENPVSQCDVTTIDCGASMVQVDSCSF